MIKDFEDLTQEVFKEICRETWDDNRLDYLKTLLKVYMQAKVDATAEGWIGVGCITYAENAMQRYQEENPYEE